MPTAGRMAGGGLAERSGGVVLPGGPAWAGRPAA